ncbi:molecular chaperone, partial [Vibrio parahaemolyticus]|nr:molecular chaperone [Vibrio parahaemolyticus]
MRSQSTHSQSMRSDIYLLLATLLRDVPSAELCTFLAELDFEANGTEMAKAWQAISAAAHNVQADSLADEYQELFIGIGRGEVVPFASWHLTGSLMEKPLAEIRDDLSRLGLERDEQVREPEDHISALCETMAYLCEQSSDENADEQTQQAFFNRHIAPWFGKLVSQIRQAPHAQFYLAVA